MPRFPHGKQFIEDLQGITSPAGNNKQTSLFYLVLLLNLAGGQSVTYLSIWTYKPMLVHLQLSLRLCFLH